MATNKEKDLFTEEDEYEDVYVPSESVTVAKDYLKQVQSSGYDRKWADRLDTLVDMYVNRTDFEYSPEDDLVWQQAKSNALREGRLAMEDTVARATALSGGYANSYAATAGAQTYQQAVADIASSAGDYYDRAYEKYRDEEARLLEEISLLGSLDDAEYSRYMDALDEANNRYTNEYARDYTAWRDSVEDKRYADETAYGREQDRLDREYTAWRDSVEDERYADESAYEREQDRLDREYKSWRDSVEDERYADETAYDRDQDRLDREYSYAKLYEDARQFDTKLSYDALRAEYDEYIKQTEKEKSDEINAEKERSKLEEKMANLKITPLYKQCLDLLKSTKDPENGIRELYVSGKLGKGEDAVLYLTLLCGDFGISPNRILE